MLQGMLESQKVLDLADQKGMSSGHILAQLGAQVIAVEPPGGNSARALAPFAGDRNGPDASLWWQAYGRGKSSLALDLNSERGSARLLELAADAPISAFADASPSQPRRAGTRRTQPPGAGGDSGVRFGAHRGGSGIWRHGVGRASADSPTANCRLRSILTIT